MQLKREAEDEAFHEVRDHRRRRFARPSYFGTQLSSIIYYLELEPGTEFTALASWPHMISQAVNGAGP